MHKALWLGLFCSSIGSAEDLDAIFEGFDDTTVPVIVVEQSELSWITLSGVYAFSTAYNYQKSALIEGVSRLRNKLDLVLDMRHSPTWKSKIELKTTYDPLYGMRDITNYTETLEYLTEIKEAYLLGSVGAWDMKIGRQIVVWGKSDNIRITDVINPMDNREMGMVDITDLRLAVGMSKLSYHSGAYSFNFLAIHESRVQYEAGLNSEFLPTHIFPLPPGASFPQAVTPTSNLEDTQFAASIDGRFSGWDLSLYWAEVLDTRWHFDDTKSNRIFTKLRMHGAAANIVWGSWLFKTEAAFLEGLRFNTTRDPKTRLDILVGAEYLGLSDWVFSLEIANRHLFDYEAKMLGAADFTREDEVTSAFRSSYSFDRDNASWTFLLTRFGPQFQDGGFARMWLEYKINDTMTATGGFIDYHASSGVKPLFDAIASNDRVFVEYKYSF